MVRMALYLVAELACVALVAVGLGLWIDPGCGLAVGGVLALFVVVAAELPARVEVVEKPSVVPVVERPGRVA